MIAISVTVHEHPHIVIDMIRNIRKTYNKKAFLIVHVSKDTKEQFFSDAEKMKLALDHGDIIWNKWNISTKWGNVLPMQISNFMYLKTMTNLPFSHFQILSPANMIIGESVEKHVLGHDVLLNKPVRVADGWYWRAQAEADNFYRKFMVSNNINDMLCARVDGAAVRVDIFAEFVSRVMSIYSIEMMQNLDPVYPMEETLLPSYLMSAKYKELRFAPTMSKTFEPNEPQITLDKIRHMINEKKLLFVKRISPNREDPIRKYIIENRT